MRCTIYSHDDFPGVDGCKNGCIVCEAEACAADRQRLIAENARLMQENGTLARGLADAEALVVTLREEVNDLDEWPEVKFRRLREEEIKRLKADRDRLLELLHAKGLVMSTDGKTVFVDGAGDYDVETVERVATDCERLRAALLAVAVERQHGPCWCRTLAGTYCVGQTQCRQAREVLET